MSVDTLVSIGSTAFIVLGALVALLGGIHAALAIVAPRTKTDADDKALAVAGKLKAALEWVAAKLAGLLGGVTGSSVVRK